MADCPNATEMPTNKDFMFIVKGCNEADVKSKLENKLLDIAKQVRVEEGSPCEGDCKPAAGDAPSCTLWLEYTLTIERIHTARVSGCPNDVGRIGFFKGSVTTAGCNCV